MEGIDFYLITPNTQIPISAKPCKFFNKSKTGCKQKQPELKRNRSQFIPRSYICLVHYITNQFKEYSVTSIAYKLSDGSCGNITKDEELIKAYTAGCKQEKYLQIWVYATEKPKSSPCASAQECAPEFIKECYFVPCYKKHSKNESCFKCKNSDMVNVYDEPKLNTIRYIIRSEIKNYLPKLQSALCGSLTLQIHENISCNNCGALSIQGPRYKCSVCTNFDFCESCEKSVHHEHPFIKIRSPEMAPKAIFCAVDESKKKLVKPKNRQCDSETRLLCRFVKDVIGNEDDVHEPGNVFIKGWRLRNDGRTEWPAGCKLAFTNGDFGGDDANLPCLMPGEERDVAVTCRCPDKDGRYNSYWRAIDPTGNRFGQRLTIKIIVKSKEEGRNESLNALIEIFNNPELVRLAYEKAGKSAQKAAEILISGSLGNITS